jgi:hypothetical protein
MGAERRRSVRVPFLATVALLRDKQYIGTFRVLNISAGGVLVAGQLPEGRSEKLEVLLQLPSGRPLRVEATVAREATGAEAPAFALQLVRVSPGAEDLIHSAVVTALQEARAAAVLMVSHSLELCVALRRELRSVGQLSFAVGSPLEAVHFFTQPSSVGAVLVDAAMGASARDDVLAYLADEHPRVLRVVVSAEESLPVSGNLPGDSSLAQEVLLKPWTREATIRALRLPARRAQVADRAPLAPSGPARGG